MPYAEYKFRANPLFVVTINTFDRTNTICFAEQILNKMFKVVSWDIAEIIHDVKYNVP